jgi:hypothetical protein
MAQISPDIIERSVQSVYTASMSAKSLAGAISTFALNFIVNLRSLFLSIKIQN